MFEGYQKTAGWHLGINLGHDRAAALVRDGAIAVAIQQERLDRNKYSVGMPLQSSTDPRSIQLPERAIRYCLDACGIDLSELVSITANMPGIDHAPKILAGALSASLRDKIRQLPSHHLAHAYSAYWPSGFEQAIILVADAGGTTTDTHETESYSLYQAQGNRIRLLHSEQVAAHLAGLSTLGFLYEYLTRKAGFVTPVGADLTIAEPGKLMGLAPYGREQRHWQPWIRFPEDGGYSLGISAYDIFLEVAALEKRYGGSQDDGPSESLKGTPRPHPWLVDLAYKVQRELEQALLYLVGQAVHQTGVKKLCLAGGVALNAVANYRLQQELPLEAVFIFPAAGDAGIAAGCALWAYATSEQDPQRKRLRRATLGHSYRQEEIHKALQTFTDRIEIQHLAPSDGTEETAGALAQGQIVACFQGGSEYGPRALGHRSILADPTFAKMRDILNARVKFREPFRPYAPVIPEEVVAEVFEQETPSPFMLLIAAIRPEYRARLPSVTHVDGSGRIQTVTAQENPWLHGLCHKIVTLFMPEKWSLPHKKARRTQRHTQ